MCLRGGTCLTADCCFSEPTLYIIQRVGLVQSRHNYRFLEILLTYFRYDIAKQCSFGAKNNHLLEFKRTFLRELESGNQFILRKAWPWSIVDNVFGECHSPCTLSTILLVASTKRLPIRFQWQSKVVDPDDPSLPSFIYSFNILFNVVTAWICIPEIMLAGRWATIMQSINQLTNK